MTLAIQVMAVDRQKNVAGVNLLMGSQPAPSKRDALLNNL
jgi:hypothetical protein